MIKISQTGVSLIEILLSIVLIGFIILAVNNVPNSIRLIGSSQKQSLAKDIASKEIEQLRLKGYNNLANSTVSVVDSRLSSLPQSSANAVISDCPVTVCSNNETIKQIVVTVSYQDDTQIKKVQLNTFISQGGIQ